MSHKVRQWERRGKITPEEKRGARTQVGFKWVANGELNTRDGTYNFHSTRGVKERQ